MKKVHLSSASGSKAPRLIKIGLVFCPCLTFNMDGSITFYLFRPVYSLITNELTKIEFVPMDGGAQIIINEYFENNYITNNTHINTLNGTGTGNVSNISTNTTQQ